MSKRTVRGTFTDAAAILYLIYGVVVFVPVGLLVWAVSYLIVLPLRDWARAGWESASWLYEKTLETPKD